MMGSHQSSDVSRQRRKEKGQVVIIVLLILVVTLAIALSVAGRSVNEIASSTKTENSSRAFSAAESGIERTIQKGVISDSSSPVNLTLPGNSSTASVNIFKLPKINAALEYPPFGKESFAQFWLANPQALSSGIPVQQYSPANTSFDIYFGDANPVSDPGYTNNPQNKPAAEIKVISWDGSAFTMGRFLVDSFNGTGLGRNGMDGCYDVASAPNYNNVSILTNDNSSNSLFYCKKTIIYGTNYPVMIRIRMLYSNLSHPVAIAPVAQSNCPVNPGYYCSLPYQANIYKSIGKSGNVQRNISVFRQVGVMPGIFDFVLFSAGDLKK